MAPGFLARSRAVVSRAAARPFCAADCWAQGWDGRWVWAELATVAVLDSAQTPTPSRLARVWAYFATVAVVNSTQTRASRARAPARAASRARHASTRRRRQRARVWAGFATVAVVNSTQTRAGVRPGAVTSAVTSAVAPTRSCRGTGGSRRPSSRCQPQRGTGGGHE